MTSVEEREGGKDGEEGRRGHRLSGQHIFTGFEGLSMHLYPLGQQLEESQAVDPDGQVDVRMP